MIAHLATIHKIAPPNNNNNNIPLKFVTNNNDYGTTTAALSELRQLRQQFMELKSNLTCNKTEQVILLLFIKFKFIDRIKFGSKNWSFRKTTGNGT